MKVCPNKAAEEIPYVWYKPFSKTKSMGGTSQLRKFYLLMWKNWLLQKRKKKQTFLEIVLSIVFCILLVVIRDLAPSETYSEPKFYKPFSISTLPATLGSSDDGLVEVIFNVLLGEEVSARKKRDIFPIYESEIEVMKSKIMNSSSVRKYILKHPNQLESMQNLVRRLERILRKKISVHERKMNGKRTRQKRFLGIFSSDTYWPLAYAPNNSFVEGLMRSVEDKLFIDTFGYGFETEEEMVKHLTKFTASSESGVKNRFADVEDVLGGVVFKTDLSKEGVPTYITYKIRLKGTPRSGRKIIALAPPPRWNTEIIYPMFQVPGPREKEEEEGGDPGYFSEGFLALQFALDKSIVQYLNGTDIEGWANVELQRMPYPPYIDDKYLVALQAWLPLILLLSYFYPAVNIVKNIVYEKEKKLKESMKMMGLSNWLHWTAWFVKSLILLLITTALVTLLLCTRWNGVGSLAVLDNSDPSLVFFFLFIYSCSGIAFSFFLSTLLSQANSGSTLSYIIWVFSYLPNIYIRPRFLSISTTMKIVMCLYFNLGMSLGCFLTSMFEGVGSGLQWHLINSGVSPDSPFSIAHIISMMILDTFIYLLLTWYIEAVRPGEFGVPQPWNFPFKKSYWFGSDPNLVVNGVTPTDRSQRYFEAEPVHLAAGIRVNDLTKKFSKRKVAVNKMRLNMYNGQITVLLGHNGAGKTTTMSMLTGLFPPSYGTAEVNGYDIVTDMDQVRNSVGICPQHDVLFDDLTVAEHIVFFSELKGLRGDKVNSEVEFLLNGIKLLDKKDAFAQTLSGGMKRKLSVSIALCGGSKVVILDEPTSGMDPGARRVIWDLLQRERSGRTMLLTTHFMEEADLLGDRIAIMTNGVVQCCGSSMFLKKLYGAGYHLTLVKDKNCDVNKITDVVTSHIPEAEIELNVAAELTYILPSEKVSEFEGLFNEFENRRSDLCISSYGASQTTMEEVFLRVGEENVSEDGELSRRVLRSNVRTPNGLEVTEAGLLLNEEYETIDLQKMDPQGRRFSIFNAAVQKVIFGSHNGTSSATKNLPPSPPPAPATPRDPIRVRNHGGKLLLQQFRAMLVKKMLYSLRNWILTIIQILIPIGFLLIAMVVLRNLPGVNDAPPAIAASLKPFAGTITPVRISDNRTNAELFERTYSQQFTDSNEVLVVDPRRNISSLLLSEATGKLPTFNLHWLCAVDIVQNSTHPIYTNLVGYFNNQPYHVPPIALNLLDQALVRMATNITNFKINTYNHPLPRNDTEKLMQETRQNVGFNIGFNLAFGLSFLSASFTLFVIKERSSNCKHLQFVSGVNCFVYWAATALWDFLCFLITIILIIVCLVVYDEEGINSVPELARVFLVLVTYCWSILPFMYVCSFLFVIPSTGFIRMCMMHLIVGMATLITVTILRIPDLNLSHVANILDWVFLIFPPYAMASAISELYSNARFTKICQKFIVSFFCGFGVFENPCCRETNSCGPFGCVLWTEDVLGWEKLGVGRMLVFMSVEGVLFYAIIAMIELHLFRSFKYFLKSLYRKLLANIRFSDARNANALAEETEDEDVRNERERIRSSSLGRVFHTDKLFIRDLTKVYPGGIVAVDHINLGVPLGECFGLLGINGAGKTSLFKMITGDLPVTSGDGYVNGFSIKTNIKKVQQEIGYCPQFDAVLDQMTGRETLRMFGRLRGVPERKLEEDINSIANQLLLTQHLDVMIGAYSGGNKRKLSTGIALIGDPPLLLLDEPTSGMDPVARRHLWSVLNNVRDAGRGIVLTSHSMEECEALCTRLAIMTNGSFRCLGSPQQLKSKFSEGYSLILRVDVEESREAEDLEITVMPPEMAKVQDFILSTFKESYLREKQWGRLEYFVPVSAASWANVFGILEENRVNLQIQDYAVTQTTLERVFLNFTRNQRPERA